ncbi:MAG: ECF transporter S component [Caldiserica bacterium]|nr:ECF transporter S component [Caldisericota bacterium]
MTRRLPARTLTTTGLLLGVGLLLPTVFHSLFGVAGGRTFLPMHYAVLLGGLLLGPIAGAFLGIATPLLSALMTGMPAVAILPPMIVELAVYGLVAGLARRRWRLVPLWSLLLAMAAGRIALGLAVTLLGPSIGLKAEPVAYVLAGIVTGLPGIAAQIVVIPLLLARGRLERSIAER